MCSRTAPLQLHVIALPVCGIVSSSYLTVKSKEIINQTHKERHGASAEDTHANLYVICTHDPFSLFIVMAPRS